MKTKLKPYLYLTFGALIIAQASLAKTESNQDAPNDFAYGANLSVSNDAPFYRVALPEALYADTVWPDLRDVRVFNREGLVQPFAFMHYDSVQNETAVAPVTVFALDNQTVEEKKGSRRQALLTAADGLTVTIPLSESDSVDKSYLLKLADDNEHSSAPNRLTLNWAKSNKNWQAKVSVFTSSDMKQWTSLIADAPLMDLTSGNERLLVNSIDLSERKRRKTDYYLLVFKAEQNITIPAIEKAEAVYHLQHSEDKTITMTFQGREVEKGVAEYTLPSPKPLKNISILPAQDNVVLPLEVEYRSSDSAKWLPLPKQVIYQLNNKNNGKTRSQPLEINDRQVQGIRIKAMNTSWGDRLPVVYGERSQVALVFNAQGSGPYLLAWGAKAAKSHSLALETLIPEPMRNKEELNAIGWAKVDASMELGGIGRLTQETPQEKESEWQKFLLWGVLIAGVLGLSLFAFKIWQEIKLKSEKPSQE
jgi:hypothetical protein